MTAINVIESTFLYKGGVYDDPLCGEAQKHAMTVVGYGVDGENGKEFVILRNSWG